MCKKDWNPETDACNECRECDYFLHEYWNCQGELEPCWEFIPKRILNEIVVTKEK
jgi:hypothetical protein